MDTNSKPEASLRPPSTEEAVILAAAQAWVDAGKNTALAMELVRVGSKTNGGLGMNATFQEQKERAAMFEFIRALQSGPS